MQGISVDLSTLQAEWESRSAAANGGGSLAGSFLGLGNEGSSVSGSGNDVNEEIDVVGGLDSCSESGSERVDSAADGSVDGECFPGLSAEHHTEVRRGSASSQTASGGLQLNLELNQQGIHHWGLSILERRRKLASLSQSAIRQASSNSSPNEDDVQSSSIDLSVKGREERKRLNPFSIDSLLGNNRSGSPATQRDNRDISTPPLTNGRLSTSPSTT